MSTLSSPKKKELVQKCLQHDILISADMVNSMTEEELEQFFNEELEKTQQATVLTKETQKLSSLESQEVNWDELERTKVFEEKGKQTNRKEIIEDIEKSAQEAQEQKNNPVKVLFSYDEENTKRKVEDFVDYFSNRYKAVKTLLLSRTNLSSHISIKHILSKKNKEQISAIGLVNGKDKTKNGNIMLTLEDPTGSIKVLVNKNKPEMFSLAEDIVNDEVIGVVGVCGERIIFANDLVLPDVPYQDMKKAPDEVYAAFLSDLHVGSNNFLDEDFSKFIDWINGNVGNDTQKELASKIKYLFIAGDLVDGVGVFPGHEEELTIPDIYEQYEACAELIKKIPSHISIIICAGNHDAVRLAEPQPPLSKHYCPSLYDLPNVTHVSNPSLVNIHSSEDFSGFNVFLYHGYSFDFYVAEVSSLRTRGGYDRPDLIMKYLLQRRHVAPTHTSSPYIPDTHSDPLVMESVPDFFVSGHIHKSSVAHYRNVTMICGSCWQAKTAFQEKVGHHPEPGRVPLVNLKTRDVKILKFGNQ